MTTGDNYFVMGGTALYSPSFGRDGEAALFEELLTLELVDLHRSLLWMS